MQSIEELNKQFGIKDCLHFTQNEAGFVMIDINNECARAQISSYAGQILSFKPHTQSEDVLFLSDKAVYRQGKAIRGGTPICWPWFGDDTSGFARPSHGFVRNQQWNVLASKQMTDGRTQVTLGLNDSKSSLAVWYYKFELVLTITVGETLEIELSTTNKDNKSFDITQALHSYFKISDVDNIVIKGLDSKDYLDKLEGFNLKNQSGDITVSEEVDRIYQYTPKHVLLVDKGLGRTIRISSSGSAATVVWNPWSTSVEKMADLDKMSYRQFVCIETANAAEDKHTIQAGETHTITAQYEVI